MKNKTQNKWLLLTTLLMFFLVASYGFIKSTRKAKSIHESYKASISLKESVVFDDKHIIKIYGEPIVLEAGTVGEIFDVFDSYSEEHGNRHIRVEFSLDENKTLDAILDYETVSEKDTGVVVDTYDATINVLDDEKEQEKKTYEVATPVLNINKINDSQKIASEFKQTRERYYQAVKQTRIKGSVWGAIVALALVAIIWCVKLIVRKEKVGKTLVILTICFDVVMVFANLIALYLTLAM